MDNLRKIIDGRQIEHMERLADLFDDMLADLKEKSPVRYKEVRYSIACMANDGHLPEDMAKEWVSSMRNKDGTVGPHWAFDQARAYAGNHDKYEFFAVLNMMYSDYFNPKFDTSTYVQLANDWLGDKDVSGGKTLKYYIFVACE